MAILINDQPVTAVYTETDYKWKRLDKENNLRAAEGKRRGEGECVSGGHLHVSEIIFNLAKVAAEKLRTSTPDTFDYLITESFFCHRNAIN